MSMLHTMAAVAGRGLSAVECPLWLIFLATIGPMTVHAVRCIRAAQRGRALAAVIGLALALRLLVPWEPIYWHYPLMNLELGTVLYTRPNTYLPWLLRVIVFDLHGGFDAALVFNLIAGTASIVLLWYAALAGGHSTRVCMLFGLLLAITPMYVRHSGSDSVYVPILFLYSACAAAYARLVTGGSWKVAAPLLVASMLLGMPIRGETALVFLCVPFFQLRGDTRIQDVIRQRAPLILLALAGLAGSLTIISLQSHSLDERLSIDPANIVLGIIAQVLCIPGGPDLPSFFPPLYAVPIWLTAIDAWRQRQWNELASLYLPIWFSRIPHLFGCAFMVGGLATTGYHVISVLFILLACARGLEHLYLRYQRGEFLAARGRRRAVLIGAGAAMICLCVHAYAFRYVEGQEMRFLRRELPREESTVLVIWDPDPSPGDDCCLSLPYPPLWAQLPKTRWIVLTLADLERPDYVRDLRFDYYYPGSTVQLADSTNWIDRHIVADERLRHQQDGLRRLRELDALVRSAHALEPVHTQTVRAHTPSFAHFKEGRVTFALYRSAREAVASERSSSAAP